MRQLVSGSIYMIIKANYRLGGINHFGNKIEERGYEISFSTKEIHDSWERYSPASGENFRIFVKPAKRYSDKAFKKIEDFIEANKKALFNAYKNNDRDEIFKILKKII